MRNVLQEIYPNRMLQQLSDPDVQDAINAVWILVAGIFCFQLQSGFGLLEVGSVRAKNAQNIMLYVIYNELHLCLSVCVLFLGFLIV
jgi:ammonia channel protein AmtB